MINPKIWQVKAEDPAMQYILSRQLGVSPLMAQFLINRGIFTVAAANEFLNASLETLHPPLLMRDMDRGVALAARALDAGQKILVYGDYDADGVTGAALLLSVMRRLGGNVDYYIPNRLELGYGLHTEVLRQARDNGVSLVITVDCGIANAAEVRETGSWGGPEIIITDHHEPPAELPAAAAVINPKRRDCSYPFRELAGVGVAYKFALALLEQQGCAAAPDEYLDLVCLGTVADIVPLQGENRILVKHGLAKLARLENPGLKALVAVSGIKTETLSTRDVSYILAPRLNAAGRLGNADVAVKLLLSQDDATATALAAELVLNNQTRQGLENVAMGEALGLLDGDSSLSAGPVLVLASTQWHPGVIGIVASRLVERYHKPVVLLACAGDLAKGSARSVAGFDLLAALASGASCLLEYGGHSMAAGLTIQTEQIDRFRELINEYAARISDQGDRPGVVELDALVSLEQITRALVDEIEMLQPYGHGNPCPLLAISDTRLLQCRGVGKNEAHLRITVGENKANFNGIGFNLGQYADELAAAREISVAFTPTINEWQGRSYLQLKVNDLQGETRFQTPEQNFGEENYFPGAGELVFFPETMLVGLRDYLLRERHAIPGALGLLQTAGGTLLDSPPLAAPVTAVEPELTALHKLEPGENPLLLLVNSARHTVQLARYFARRTGFGATLSSVNGFMEADHRQRELHKIMSGAAKMLISTYACHRELTAGRSGLAWARIILVRPPALRADWQHIAAGAQNAGSGLIQAAYAPDDWLKEQLYIDELAPERETLVDFYKILRSLAPGGAATCPVEQLLTLMGRLGHQAASIILATVAAAIFKDLGLLQYEWEEDMLRYKLLPGDGRRRELNESDAFVWTRRIKREWLDWIESVPRSEKA